MGEVTRASSIIVLSEDQRHQQFVRRFLRRLGIDNHAIRFRELPAGRGSGEQWVREKYADEVNEYRRRSAKAHSALIVVIDADLKSVTSRLEDLRTSLQENGIEDIASGEIIVRLIPRRAIETWILCLTGTVVNEVDDYRNSQGIDSKIPVAAVNFFDWSRPNASVPAHCIPSLRSAIPEARKLDSIA